MYIILIFNIKLSSLIESATMKAPGLGCNRVAHWQKRCTIFSLNRFDKICSELVNFGKLKIRGILSKEELNLKNVMKFILCKFE